MSLPLIVQALSPEAFAPYGVVLGQTFPGPVPESAFHNAATDFCQQHIFRSGDGDAAEVLWVNYRSSEPVITHLEKHMLTQQAIVPLTGAVVQVLAGCQADGSVDMASLVAFVVEPGQGICMHPHIWHATRALSTAVTCLMLTRSSTTRDLVQHLSTHHAAKESAIAAIPAHTLQEAVWP